MTYSDVIEHFKTPTALAEALGITRHAVYMWRGKIPRVQQLQIQILTGGKLKATEIKKRPAA